jgi:hypothetical protein
LAPLGIEDLEPHGGTPIARKPLTVEARSALDDIRLAEAIWRCALRRP